MPSLRVLNLHGTHYEMGYQHGEAHADDIRQITEERIHLSTDETWTGRSLPYDHVMELAEECVAHHWDYAPLLMEQVQGISDATGLGIPELIIANGFTDFADVIYNALEREPKVPIFGNECTSFMTGNAASENGQGMLGQTWDMHATATPYVILLHGQPNGEPDFLAFTITGCLAMIGMNEEGLAVGINNLAMADGQPGVMWPFICRKVLQQTNIEDALEAITSARLAGGHSYILMDGNGTGYNVEATTTAHHVRELTGESLVHANICLAPEMQAVERPLTDDLSEDSVLRYDRAKIRLNQENITPEDLMTLTRSREDGAFSVCAMADPPFYSETCGAVIMRPGTREFWGCWGLPNQNEYERFTL